MLPITVGYIGAVPVLICKKHLIFLQLVGASKNGPVGAFQQPPRAVSVDDQVAVECAVVKFPGGKFNKGLFGCVNRWYRGCGG